MIVFDRCGGRAEEHSGPDPAAGAGEEHGGE